MVPILSAAVTYLAASNWRDDTCQQWLSLHSCTCSMQLPWGSENAINQILHDSENTAPHQGGQDPQVSGGRITWIDALSKQHLQGQTRPMCTVCKHVTWTACSVHVYAGSTQACKNKLFSHSWGLNLQQAKGRATRGLKQRADPVG